jgi:flagellar basal-body rod modification protein FlgD
MIDGVSSNTTSTQDSTKSKTTSPQNQLATKDTFLQLLVAQIKYQDPLQPQDGVQFVTQLAQFTSLEQTMDMSNNIAAIRGVVDKSAAASVANATSQDQIAADSNLSSKTLAADK